MRQDRSFRKRTADASDRPEGNLQVRGVAAINDADRARDRQGAEAAFAAQAVEDHLDASRFQRVKHAPRRRRVDLLAEPRDFESERNRRPAPAGAERLEAQTVLRANGGLLFLMRASAIRVIRSRPTASPFAARS